MFNSFWCRHSFFFHLNSDKHKCKIAFLSADFQYKNSIFSFECIQASHTCIILDKKEQIYWSVLRDRICLDLYSYHQTKFTFIGFRIVLDKYYEIFEIGVKVWQQVMINTIGNAWGSLDSKSWLTMTLPNSFIVWYW